MSELNPSDPEVWWRMLVEAVAGLQAGLKAQATAYLQFVEQHRGRAAADKEKATLIRYRDSPAFKDCHLWWKTNYRPPPKQKGKP